VATLGQGGGNPADECAASGRIAMSGYSIVILICSALLSHADCQLNTALDVVRGPQVTNPVMCALNAQTMIARTDLVQSGSEYMKVLCAPIKSKEEWIAEIEAREAAGAPSSRPFLFGGGVHFAYFPGPKRVSESFWRNITNKSHRIVAYVDQPGDGVLAAAGGARGGFSLFVKDGRPTYEYNWLGQNRYRLQSSDVLPTGKSTIRVEFKSDGRSPAKGGSVTMFLNDKNVAEGRVEMTDPASASEETFDVGLDSGSPVSNQYIAPFEFAGVIDRIEVTEDLSEERPQASP
jgi:hypothetical protein